MKKIIFICKSFLLLAIAVNTTEAATLYTGDGVLSTRLETERWAINRARSAPEMEADRLLLTNSTPGGHPDYDVGEDINAPNDFGTTTNEWALWKQSKQPLAPNGLLNTASDKHCQDLARVGFLTHFTPAGSLFYAENASTIDRALAEGYVNTVIGFVENLASGSRGSSISYPVVGQTPISVHENLFIDSTSISRGHRQAILNENAREIGLGNVQINTINGMFFFTTDYDTQMFARRSTNHFYTGTIFNDSNTNNMYDENEGLENVEVYLWNGTNEATYYDRSQPSGNFAIPINDLPDGEEIAVELLNQTGGNVTLTLPLGYNTLGTRTLTNGESYFCGSFIQPNGITNIGFRNITSSIALRNIALSNQHICITFDTLGLATYVIQSSENLTSCFTKKNKDPASDASYKYSGRSEKDSDKLDPPIRSIGFNLQPFTVY
ncbi:MAG: hypothetical protein GKR87_00775 [Kiritimatiellae bacterium]|nr:hypothetical protein [Kiritimatiellia bacterium]